MEGAKRMQLLHDDEVSCEHWDHSLGSFWTRAYFSWRLNHISLENQLGTKCKGKHEINEKEPLGASLDFI